MQLIQQLRSGGESLFFGDGVQNLPVVIFQTDAGHMSHQTHRACAAVVVGFDLIGNDVAHIMTRLFQRKKMKKRKMIPQMMPNLPGHFDFAFLPAKGRGAGAPILR